MGRDPFPMTSEQAQSLAASVGGDQDKEWHTMDTESEGAAPKASVAFAEDRTSLVKGSKKKKSDDIYEQDEEEDEDPEDEFLDTPLTAFRGSPFERAKQRLLRTLRRVYIRLYGEHLPPEEMLRTLCLATTLFFMIGGYWLLRSLKDPVLTALCGISVIPKAKMLSVFIVLGVVSIYNRLLDTDIPRHQLFYIFGSFYFVLFMLIALLLMHPTIGLANQQQTPTRILGWISYCSIESFGSVMVSLFWSFANSNFSLETAKASYGVMVATAQVGSIIGPTIVNQFGAKWGPARCYMLGAFCMLLLQGTMYTYIRIYGAHERNLSKEQPQKKKAKAGVLEGLNLFREHNYVKGIFAISCLFMVEVTIVDFTMKMLAKEHFAKLHPCDETMSCWNDETGDHGMSEDATAGFTTFMGLFGQATNTLSLLLSLLGTSAVIRFFGLRLTLLLFPTLCLAVIIFVRLSPTLYVVFAAMMLLKANSYALNNPTKEILYQPTSSAVKYKAKSWIDIFGARGSKALGSVVTNAFSYSASALVANGSLVGMAVASFLIWNARFMGKKFDDYMASGHIVGADESELVDSDDVQMAMVQNDDKDTSCAIVDDEEAGGDEDEDESDEEDVEEGDAEAEEEDGTNPKARITQV